MVIGPIDIDTWNMLLMLKKNIVYYSTDNTKYADAMSNAKVLLSSILKEYQVA